VRALVRVDPIITAVISTLLRVIHRGNRTAAGMSNSGAAGRSFLFRDHTAARPARLAPRP
jgi:hypothetical protein